MGLTCGFGTKRNCLGAHDNSGTEGRPAVPSTWQRQPPLTQTGRRPDTSAISSNAERDPFVAVHFADQPENPCGGRPSPIWGGIRTRAGEMVALWPSERGHARTGGACSLSKNMPRVLHSAFVTVRAIVTFRIHTGPGLAWGCAELRPSNIIRHVDSEGRHRC